MVSGSSWCGSSSPIISTILRAKKAFCSLSINFNKFFGMSNLFANSSYLKLGGNIKPSFNNASANAKSFADIKYFLFFEIFLKFLIGVKLYHYTLLYLREDLLLQLS